MSQFECKEGCIMNARERKANRCDAHGLPIAYMDGMSARQVAQMEKEEAEIAAGRDIEEEDQRLLKSIERMELYEQEPTYLPPWHWQRRQ